MKKRKTLEEQIAELERKKEKLEKRQKERNLALYENFFGFVIEDIALKKKIEDNIKNQDFKDSVKKFLKEFKIVEKVEEREKEE